MSYTIAVPLVGQTIAQTTTIIQANFADISTWANINHVGFDVTDAGKHKFIQMPSQGAPPATGGAEGAIYTDTLNGRVNPKYRFQSGGSFSSVQCPLLPVKAFCQAANGGAIVAADCFNVTSCVGAAGNYLVSMPNALANTNYVVQVSGRGLSGGIAYYIGVDIISTTQFRIFTKATNGVLSDNGPYMITVFGV